ncbi:hypothetical protein DMH01_40225 [Amycolatopsis sp. WAC 04182]|uniref:hypothetical protein n=1 Tax=Amycolatopsis sp. WAC 04182 TaxID=2203198 RepID=UPI000F7710A5|nr:hypothetical protein [Amycolatopsis sp. WAC 04182]RSN53019.1 hypothetical protein DMH01_40225 [Amycolatopsis sp. WAC 04182]
MSAYLASQVKERTHREVLGPLLPASGTSGVILHRGERIAAWGDPETPEMAGTSITWHHLLQQTSEGGGELWGKPARPGSATTFASKLDRAQLDCPRNPGYGYLWWLNGIPSAPPTGRFARGSADQYLPWIDPDRDLVIVSRWGQGVDQR